MTKRDITRLSYKITGCAIKVHKALGPGLLESIYEKCLYHELQKNGFEVKQQLIIPVFYDNLRIDTELKLDLLVNDLIVLELKTVETILPVHEAQILTYMKLLEAPQGLLINFFTDNIVKSMKPFVNDYFSILED
jgi:GxxExxY protein